MRQLNPTASPVSLPPSVTELCAHLEGRGLRTFSHGEGLLAHLRNASPPPQPPRPPRQQDPSSGEHSGSRRVDAHSLLCLGMPDEILRALPRAVVTSEGATRLTQSTAAGPVDVVCCGHNPIEDTLQSFGLGPFGLAFRPADESWVDPQNQFAAMADGRLELMQSASNPFLVAPRRYWIAARLLAENNLEASAQCLDAATEALPAVGDRLPQASPARREISRILEAPAPGVGLAFLRETGVGALLFPGTKAANEERITLLPRLPAVRWAAWLRGSATARVLVRLRTPHALARRIERVQAHHPIERFVESTREHGIRKLMQKLEAPEIEALFAWRRLELSVAKDRSEALSVESRLVTIEQQIQDARAAEARTSQVRALALGGQAVMDALGAGPGRHVGQALSHLARFVAERPELNNAAALEAELFDWAKKNSNLLD